METLVSYLDQSLFLLALGASLGSVVLVGFVKSCSHFGLMPAKEEAAEVHQYLESEE
jgi:hypothetical protein